MPGKGAINLPSVWLAARLGVTREQLERWIGLSESPPSDVFLKLVDIIWDQAVEESKHRASQP